MYDINTKRNYSRLSMPPAGWLRNAHKITCDINKIWAFLIWIDDREVAMESQYLPAIDSAAGAGLWRLLRHDRRIKNQ